MKARIVIPLTLIGLLSVGGVYAMTNTKSLDTCGNVILKFAAKSGDAVAQMWLGNYWRGKKDYAKANYWYEKAAAQGDAGAENNLGGAYYHGQGVPQDYAKANSWYEKAAAQGYAWAELNLGNAYYHGHGVPQDYAKAVYWYEKAAAQGDAGAENNLGGAYYHGQGVPQDYAKANSWYEKAAAQRNAMAEYNMGNAYYHGQGVPQDTMTAITWWKKAAAHGGRAGRDAQYNINVAEARSVVRKGKDYESSYRYSVGAYWDVFSKQCFCDDKHASKTAGGYSISS